MSEVNSNTEAVSPGPVPRNVRDGAVAAAIGVSLELAFRADNSRKSEPVQTAESIWVYGTRASVIGHSPNLQIHDRWGVLSGWKPVTGRWSVKR